MFNSFGVSEGKLSTIISDLLVLQYVDVKIKNRPLKDDWPFVEYWLNGIEDLEEEDLYEKLKSQNTDVEAILKQIPGKYYGAELLRVSVCEKNPLNLTIKIHLLIENFLNVIFAELKYPINKRKGFELSFSEKVNFLNKKKLLPEKLFNDLRLLNNLRNLYAHSYFFEIGNFPMNKFSIANNLYLFTNADLCKN